MAIALPLSWKAENAFAGVYSEGTDRAIYGAWPKCRAIAADAPDPASGCGRSILRLRREFHHESRTT